MMGRNANLDFYGWEYEFSVEGANQESGRLPDDAERQGWFPYFPCYREDPQGRLLYLYQPLCGRTQTLQDDIAWMRAHPRSHFTEVYDRIEIRDEWNTYALVKTLHQVTLFEALDELVTIFKAKDAAIRERDLAERRRRQADWRRRP
jgi:hypothetical protein